MQNEKYPIEHCWKGDGTNYFITSACVQSIFFLITTVNLEFTVGCWCLVMLTELEEIYMFLHLAKRISFFQGSFIKNWLCSGEPKWGTRVMSVRDDRATIPLGQMHITLHEAVVCAVCCHMPMVQWVPHCLQLKDSACQANPLSPCTWLSWKRKSQLSHFSVRVQRATQPPLFSSIHTKTNKAEGETASCLSEV